MLAGQIYHIVISICEINDLGQSPVLRLGPKLIRNRACCDVWPQIPISVHLFGKSYKLTTSYLNKENRNIRDLNEFGQGAAPRAQIR